jgi:glucokinase
MRIVLALDIGGTKLAAGVVSESGEVLADRVEVTDASVPAEAVLEKLMGMAGEAVGQAGVAWGDLSGAGVSFGGPVDFPSGRTVTCHHLAGWEGFPLREAVRDRSGLPTVIDNDANAAALGEATFGAARGCAHALYLTVSTGIGGGVIIDGRVYRGAASMAGEIGHTLVAPDGPVCTCGKRGCLEAVASGPSIARAAREALETGEASALASIPRSRLTAKDIAEAAVRDTLAACIMGQAGEFLGIAIAGAVNLLNPNVVVIGGGVSGAGDVLFGPVREAVARYAVPESARELRLVAGELGQRGALLGAAALALTQGKA